MFRRGSGRRGAAPEMLVPPDSYAEHGNRSWLPRSARSGASIFGGERIALAARGRAALAMAIVGSVLTGGFACSSTTGPKPAPTVLVMNATCQPGPCKTLYLRAYIWGWAIPQPPTGIKLLGFVHGPGTCLQFPPEWTLWVVAGSDSTLLTWKPPNPAGIFLLAFDSAIGYGNPTRAQLDSSNEGLWPYDGATAGSVGHSATFVPGNSPGWSITFPPTTLSGAATPGIKASDACTP